MNPLAGLYTAAYFCTQGKGREKGEDEIKVTILKSPHKLDRFDSVIKMFVCIQTHSLITVKSR